MKRIFLFFLGFSASSLIAQELKYVAEDSVQLIVTSAFNLLFLFVILVFVFYLLTRMAFVRKVFVMSMVDKQGVIINFLMLTILMSIIFWFLISIANYYMFDSGSGLYESFFPQNGSQDLFFRVVVETIILIGGVLISMMFTRFSLRYRAAKKQEEFLDLALFAANDGIWDWHVSGGWIRFDERYYTMSGYEPGEFPEILEEWEKRVHQDDIDRVYDLINLCLDGKREFYDAEFRFLQKNGSYQWIRGRGQIVSYDENFKPKRFLGTHSDITDRKNIQEELVQNLEYLQTIYNTLPIIIWSADNNKIVTLIEGKDLTCFNLKPGQLLGRHLDDLYEESPDVIDRIDLCLAGRQEEYERESNGQIYHTILTPIYSNSNEVEGITGIAMNVTEQRSAERELHKLRIYLSNIINSMPSFLIGVDNTGRITQWNRAIEEQTGIAANDAEGRKISDVLPRMNTEIDNIFKSINNKEVIQQQKKNYVFDDGTHYEDITIYPLVSNGVEGAVVRIDDVTDKVRMEEMMIQSEKMLSVGGLAAGMAHEINNPLAGIMQTASVMTQRLLNLSGIDANIKAAVEAGTNIESVGEFMKIRGILRMLETINASGERVAKIVNNMLSFSRKSETASSSYDIHMLLEDTLELATTDYDMKQYYDFKLINVVHEYEVGLPFVICKKSKIQQVLLNIIRNAAQAMTAASIENPTLIIRTSSNSERKKLKIEIEDNGPGMDEKIRKRVFEPFFTTKPEGIGTGLGLSVSYFIITNEHGGEMTVSSEIGRGTIFRINLLL
jgi:PAS domain S-box-containing protein